MGNINFKLSFGILTCIILVVVIWLFGPYSAHIEFLTDKGPGWYYWVLPNPDVWTRASAWSLYLLHQFSIWYLIYAAKQKKLSASKTTLGGLHPINWIALGLNLAFILLHIVQTKYFYDGLAQDTNNYMAMMSVVLVLSFILIIENPRRGLLLGKKVNWLNNARHTVKLYHGYYFSWAMIFTFWFHPIETTLGHLLGNLYMFFFLLQSSLIFTPFHTNKYWRVFLEIFVVIHAVVVAYFSVHQESVSMFGFGFLTMFFLTYIFGLGLSRAKIIILHLIYWVCVISFYSGDLSRLTEIIRIPVVLYLTAAVLALLCIGFNKISRTKSIR